MKPVIIHGDARSELDEAMSYYEGCADGLGLDPQTRIEEMIAKIRENPEVGFHTDAVAFGSASRNSFPSPYSIWSFPIISGSSPSHMAADVPVTG